MPAFDIVSKIDMGEMKNVVNQADREISTRYDFKGSKSKIILEENHIELKAEDEYKIKAILDILRSKMAKRDIGMNAVEPGEIKPSGNRELKQLLTLKQGIDKEQGKIINKIVKNSKLKISSSTLDEKIRITGKKIDDLQQIWGIIRTHKDVKIELQMENMK